MTQREGWLVQGGAEASKPGTSLTCSMPICFRSSSASLADASVDFSSLFLSHCDAAPRANPPNLSCGSAQSAKYIKQSCVHAR